MIAAIAAHSGLAKPRLWYMVTANSFQTAILDAVSSHPVIGNQSVWLTSAANQQFTNSPSLSARAASYAAHG